MHNDDLPPTQSKDWLKHVRDLSLDDAAKYGVVATGLYFAIILVDITLDVIFRASHVMQQWIVWGVQILRWVVP